MKRKLGLISVALLMSLNLAACGGNSGTSTPTAAAGNDTSTAASGERAMEGNMYVTGLPIVKEKETFTLFCDDNGVPEEKVMYDIYEEQTNVHVELMLMPWQAATEKLNVLLNSGDYPDMIGGWILKDKDVMQMGMGEGTFIPLEGLFEKYTPKIEEILSLEGVRETMTLPDHHIYTIPYVIGEPIVTFCPWINEVWLDKLGLDMPQTVEQLKEVLIAFRDQDPNGNGLKDEIPYSADPNNLHMGALAGYFGVDAYAHFTMQDDKLVFGGTQEGYKEAMKWLAGLYKEGLIDPELFTQDLSQWKAKGNKDLYGVSMAYGSGDFAVDKTLGDPNRDNTKRKTEYEPLPVLSSAFSSNPVYHRNAPTVSVNPTTGNPDGVTIFRTQAVITDKAKNPATIVRYYDNLFEFENSFAATNGPLGIKWEKLPDGQYRDIDVDAVLTEEQKDTYSWAKVYTQSMPRFVPSGFQTLPPEGKQKDYDEGAVRNKLYESQLNEMVPKFWLDDSIAQRAAIIETDIDGFMKKTVAEWVTGQKDVEAEWDGYLKSLENLGLPELLKIKQDAIANME